MMIKSANVIAVPNTDVAGVITRTIVFMIVIAVIQTLAFISATPVFHIWRTVYIMPSVFATARTIGASEQSFFSLHTSTSAGGY